MGQQVRVYRALEFYPSGGGLRSLQITPQTNGIRIESDDRLEFYDDGLYIASSTDGQLDIVADTTLTITAPTITIVGDIGLTGDIALADEDVSVAQGDYIYLDGDGGGEYIYSETQHYMEIKATTGIDLKIGSTDEVAITATAVTLASNNLTLTAGNLTVGGTSALQDNVTMTSGKYVYLRGTSEYIVSDGASNLMMNAATTVSLAIGGTDEVNLSANVFSPAVTDGCALGSTTYYWSDLFLASGGVLNFNNDVTITHSSNLLEVAGGGIRMKDSCALFMGDSDDVRIQWAAGILSFMPITDNTGMITFGTGGRQMDVRFYGATATAYCDWDNSASRWVFTNAHTHLKDGCHLYMGNDNDINLYWTGAGGLRLTYYAHDTLDVQIGANSKNIDWKWWMGASSYVLFDVGNLAVTLAAMDLVLDNTKRIYFSAGGANIWSNTVNNRMDFNASGGIYVNNDMRIVTNYKLYLGNESTVYFDPDTAGHMKLYSTQATITSTLVNATAIMLDAGTGGGGVAVRGFLRLWVTGSVGDTKGQIWYDSVSNKIHFWNGTAEQEVTSGGA